MKYTYDIVLNFCNDERSYEFYEWKKEDTLLTIQKIPILRTNKKKLEQISNNKIKISKLLLEKIDNKTTLENGKKIKYALLITDLSRVIALEFNNCGEVIKSSNLLLDEEEAVIDECLDYKEEKFDFEILKSYSQMEFLTREERKIRNNLLSELKYMYSQKNYDEINYLYAELYNDKITIHKKYAFLVNDIKNNYSQKYNKLYDIIKLT